MILNEGQPEAWRVHTISDASPTLYAERPLAILQGINKKKYRLLFPLDFAGTLCARDGIKTGPKTPNGEDAYDRKLVVMSKKRKKAKVMCFENHATDSRISEIDVAMCMGSTRNANASNNNPIIVGTSNKKMRHLIKKTFTRPRNDVFEPSDTALCLGASHNM